MKIAVTYENGMIFQHFGHTMYSELVSSYQQTFNSFVGPCEVLVSGETLQINDYSKLDWEWSMFDPGQKKKRRETVFP